MSAFSVAAPWRMNGSRKHLAGVVLAWCWVSGCSASSTSTQSEAPTSVAPDAPVVAQQPGAWFDARGGLTVVGPGRRLRLSLSAPIAACAPAFTSDGDAAERAAAASLPYSVLADACRDSHPAILLDEESATASPAELERSYHEVARCVAAELGAMGGWIPSLVEEGDPCVAALGRGFRLPTAVELAGLTIDDRKAIAGALFDTEHHSDFGSLLLYARGSTGKVELVTLSPNSAEQAPALTEASRERPFFGAALRCVLPSATDREIARSTPRLPNAASCLRTLRAERTLLGARASAPATPELTRLKAWVQEATRSPALLQSDAGLRELNELLAAPALERLAREGESERALTEHYAELADALDDPSVSESERARRRAEFDSLRKRLGDQIVRSSSASGEATQLSALVAHLVRLIEERAASAPGKAARKSGRRPAPLDYAPLLTRLRSLSGSNAEAR